MRRVEFPVPAAGVTVTAVVDGFGRSAERIEVRIPLADADVIGGVDLDERQAVEVAQQLLYAAGLDDAAQIVGDLYRAAIGANPER